MLSAGYLLYLTTLGLQVLSLGAGAACLGVSALVLSAVRRRE